MCLTLLFSLHCSTLACKGGTHTQDTGVNGSLWLLSLVLTGTFPI